MKPYILAVIIAALFVLGAFYYLGNGGEVIYQKPQISATSTNVMAEEEVEEKIPKEWEEEARQAYEGVIRKNKLETMEAEMIATIRAEQAAHKTLIEEKEAAHETSIDEKQAALDEVRKELGSY